MKRTKEDIFQNGKPGDFSLVNGNNDIWLVLPGPENVVLPNLVCLPIHKKDEQPTRRTSWEWDGNEEAPTLWPSIESNGIVYFHGYYRDGKLTDVEGVPC